MDAAKDVPMNVLHFEASLNPNGTLNVPSEVAERVKDLASFQVVLLVPADNEEPADDEAWRRLGIAQFVKGYADSDSIYDDL